MVKTGRLEGEWPALAERLRARLSGRLPEPDREEVIDEVYLTLVAAWDEVDESKPLWPLVLSIALYLQPQTRIGSLRRVLP